MCSMTAACGVHGVGGHGANKTPKTQKKRWQKRYNNRTHKRATALQEKTQTKTKARNNIKSKATNKPNRTGPRIKEQDAPWAQQPLVPTAGPR